VIKVHDLAWLEFSKPDLDRAEAFARAFGFSTARRSDDELHLRGTRAGSACVVVRRGATGFAGVAFTAADRADLNRLAAAVEGSVVALPEELGGHAVELRDPNGLRVNVVSDTVAYPSLDAREPLPWNVGRHLVRVNATQRPPRGPARVERLGHVVVESTTFQSTLDWYLEMFGLIVSDFLYYDGQRHLGPTMAFIRCDRGHVATDHHTLAITLGPSNRYVHSAYQVSDLDALAAGGEHLASRGYRRSWGIGRHVQGSQIFDYWRDPDGLLFEHFVDGDVFDSTIEPGWTPMTASGLAQWGPPATKDFLGVAPGRDLLRAVGHVAHALRDDNEFDLTRLRGLLKVAAT